MFHMEFLCFWQLLRSKMLQIIVNIVDKISVNELVLSIEFISRS